MRAATRSIEHHAARLDEVIAALRDGHDTAWELTPHMTWSRPIGETDPFTRRVAVSEAMAHLRLLEVRGIAQETIGEPSRWKLL